MERGPGCVRFGWLQFLWGWSGDKTTPQWSWYNPHNGEHGDFKFYGVALGETFIGVVR